MPYAMAIFDFDGTLMDTSEAITATFLQTMDEVGVERPSREAITDCIGLALPVALSKFAGPSFDVDYLCATYRAIFSRCAPGHTTPYAGIVELIEGLHASGVTLAVATNRSRASALEMLEEHDMLAMFRDVIGGTCVPRPKPEPQMLHRLLDGADVRPSDAVMVGDTVYDVEAGRAAGTSTCAVVYGMHGRARLESADPTYLAESPGEIKSVWHR